MPLTELEAKEALRLATDWLWMTDPPGADAAREGIATVIPLVMMGEITPNDLDELASIVEQNGEPVPDPEVPRETQLEQMKAAVKEAFEHVKSARGGTA